MSRPQSPVGYPNIQVTKGMAGWFAVKIWWNPEGYPEPWESGQGRYPLQADAILEAQKWAKHENLPFVIPTIDTNPARTDYIEQIKEIVPDIEVIELDE